MVRAEPRDPGGIRFFGGDDDDPRIVEIRCGGKGLMRDPCIHPDSGARAVRDGDAIENHSLRLFPES